MHMVIIVTHMRQEGSRWSGWRWFWLKVGVKMCDSDLRAVFLDLSIRNMWLLGWYRVDDT